MEYFTLRNGLKVPCISNGPMVLGYGKKIFISLNVANRILKKVFFEPLESQKYIRAVSEAIKMGYTFLDYSSSYGDGLLIRNAIKRSGVSREKLILTCRVSNQEQLSGDIQKAVESQMKAFRTDYIDLLMFHWPVPNFFLKTWKAMESLYEQGLCRAIGVANCHQHHLEDIFQTCNIPPMINQVEVHPLFSQKPLLSYCKEKSIQIQAYTPIARYDDRLMRLPGLHNIANKYGKTVPQIILKWHIGGGNSCYS